MEKIILIMWLLIMSLLLTSCGLTKDELKEYKKNCEDFGSQFRISRDWKDWVCETKPDKVMECIREYTYWLDEKYNNPDNVSNLKEDDYSQVVKTCNEIFWEKNLNVNK